LIALGYQDAMKRSDDLLAFLGGLPVASSASGLVRRLGARREAALREEERAEPQQ